MAIISANVPNLSSKELGVIMTMLTDGTKIKVSDEPEKCECNCNKTDKGVSTPIGAETDGESYVTVQFEDGTSETATIKEGKEFHLYEGIKNCCLMHYLGKKYKGILAKIYKNAEYVTPTDEDDDFEDYEAGEDNPFN